MVEKKEKYDNIVTALINLGVKQQLTKDKTSLEKGDIILTARNEDNMIEGTNIKFDKDEIVTALLWNSFDEISIFLYEIMESKNEK